MFKKKIFSQNDLHWINYFIIKEDREKMGEKIKGTRTEKLFAFKSGDYSHIQEIVGWVADILDTDPIVIVPYPSTNPNKDKSIQLPYVVAGELAKINKNWIDGSGYLKRKFELPKNTRDVNSQYESLEFELNKEFKNFPILLLDDVTTSGSSLEAGLKVIREKSEKGQEISSLAVAKKVFLKEVPPGALY